MHPNRIIEWKWQLFERAADVFGGADTPAPVDLVPLHAKIGQLALENGCFRKRAHQSSNQAVFRRALPRNLPQLASPLPKMDLNN